MRPTSRISRPRATRLSCPVTRSTSVRSSTPLTRPTCGGDREEALGGRGGEEEHGCRSSCHARHNGCAAARPLHSKASAAQRACRKSAPDPAPSSVPSRPAAGESSSSTLSGVAPTACTFELRRRICELSAERGQALSPTSSPAPFPSAPLLLTCVASALSVASGSRESTRTVPSNMPAARYLLRCRPSGTGATPRQATSPPSSRFSLSTSMPCGGGGERGGAECETRVGSAAAPPGLHSLPTAAHPVRPYNARAHAVPLSPAGSAQSRPARRR